MAKKSKVSIGVEALREAILSGKYNGNDGFISEKRLIEFLGLSKVSVRRCISELQKENYLRSIPYKGYVIGPAAIQKKYETMAKGKTKKRIIFLEDINQASSTRYGRIIEAARSEAKIFGYDFHIFDLDPDSLIREVKKTPDVFTTVAVLKSDQELIDPLLQSGVPAIMVEYLKEGVPLDSIVQDDRGGIELAFDLLWKKNHRRIGLTVWNRNYFQPIRRMAAFTASLLRRNVIEPGLIGTSDRFDAEGGRECVRNILEVGPAPTALIIAHLEMAEGVLDELHERGIEPGRDISLIAWGTEEIKKQYLMHSRWFDLPIDLITWSREEMGRMVVRMFEARFQNPFIPPLRVEIPAEMADFDSVKTL